jgi:alkaline phosphatase
MIRHLLLLFFIFLIASCTPKPGDSNSPGTVNGDIPAFNRPKNIILMIGDGMGLTQITAGMYSNGNQLYLEKFPFIGLHKSYASNKLITDSAAGATAFACGVKTYNGAIGVDPDTIAVKNILEEAEQNGLATGLIATSTIVHATPASFIAHQKQRKMYEEIAADFLKTEIDLFIGGGKKYFANRNDGKNILGELAKKGYVLSDYFRAELSELDIDDQKNFGYFTANDDPLPVASGRDYLVPAAKMAPPFLDNHTDKGFFLMIEGAQIDWGGHANDSEYIITEMIDFDKAIGEVLQFAMADGETLVIVTADHETGGYAINPGSEMNSIIGGFTSTYHTASLIPVFAFGPGAELFTGIYENTAIYHKMRMAYGFNDPKGAQTIR